jgi:DNA-binding GntR family transcriptional regulator
MTGTAMAVAATDTGALIKRWRVSDKRTEQIAAELAAKIAAGRLRRWQELPARAVLADDYDVSESTITSVKSLLAAHSFLALENRRYYIA